MNRTFLDESSIAEDEPVVQQINNSATDAAGDNLTNFLPQSALNDSAYESQQHHANPYRQYVQSPYDYQNQSVLPNAEPRHSGPAKPIMICPGDFSGAGKEFRYPLGEGLNCQVKLSDNMTVCNDSAYWYCD